MLSNAERDSIMGTGVRAAGHGRSRFACRPGPAGRRRRVVSTPAVTAIERFVGRLVALAAGRSMFALLLILGLLGFDAPAAEAPSSESSSDTAASSTTITFEEFQAAILKSGLWTGGNRARLEEVGRNSLATAIEYGLMPEHKVLDIGAGSLRVGWWLLQYIEPSNYYAIEPNKKRIDAAASIIGAEINIYYNEDFEFPGVSFDFVIARSIWTHASKSMISKMLAEFAENSAPDAKFLTSVWLASWEGEDYKGDKWIGRVKKSDKPGMVRHSLGWIKKECKKHGLMVEVKEELNRQTWLLIERE